jgi:hypothetical protein
MNLRNAQHLGDMKVGFPQPLDKLLTLGAVHLSGLQARKPIRGLVGYAYLPVTRVHV